MTSSILTERYTHLSYLCRKDYEERLSRAISEGDILKTLQFEQALRSYSKPAAERFFEDIYGLLLKRSIQHPPDLVELLSAATTAEPDQILNKIEIFARRKGFERAKEILLYLYAELAEREHDEKTYLGWAEDHIDKYPDLFLRAVEGFLNSLTEEDVEEKSLLPLRIVARAFRMEEQIREKTKADIRIHLSEGGAVFVRGRRNRGGIIFPGYAFLQASDVDKKYRVCEETPYGRYPFEAAILYLQRRGVSAAFDEHPISRVIIQAALSGETGREAIGFILAHEIQHLITGLCPTEEDLRHPPISRSPLLENRAQEKEAIIDAMASSCGHRRGAIYFCSLLYQYQLRDHKHPPAQTRLEYVAKGEKLDPLIDISKCLSRIILGSRDRIRIGVALLQLSQKLGKEFLYRIYFHYYQISKESGVVEEEDLFWGERHVHESVEILCDAIKNTILEQKCDPSILVIVEILQWAARMGALSFWIEMYAILPPSIDSETKTAIVNPLFFVSEKSKDSRIIEAALRCSGEEGSRLIEEILNGIYAPEWID